MGDEGGGGVKESTAISYPISKFIHYYIDNFDSFSRKRIFQLNPITYSLFKKKTYSQDGRTSRPS